MTFDELCTIRAKKGEAKYTVWECRACGGVSVRAFGSPTGLIVCSLCGAKGVKGPHTVNGAMHRNNALDVAEELADAVNITRLWIERIEQSDGTLASMWQKGHLLPELEHLGLSMMHFSKKCHDGYPVERDVLEANR